MAIKKNGSRFSERNKIRKMNAQGYALTQIANALSITEAHITYVLESWDKDEEKAKNKAQALREAENDLAAQRNQLPGAAEAVMREQIKREILAQMELDRVAPVEKPAPEPAPVVVETDAQDELDLLVVLDDEELPPSDEEEPKPRRRKTA